MTNTITKTTYSQALKGDKDCLEMAFEQLANKIEDNDELEIIEKGFLILHLRECAQGRKKSGRHAVGIDTKFAVFLEMGKIISTGKSKTRASKEVKVEIRSGKFDKNGNPILKPYIRTSRIFLNNYNEMCELGWKYTDNSNIDNQAVERLNSQCKVTVIE